MANRKIGIIIVTFNNVYHTLSAVGSVLSSEFGNAEILVVDNGSAAAYAETLGNELKIKFPNAGFLHIEEDKGYGGACNIGAQNLSKKGCDLLLFLNNDIILHPQCISSLITNFEKENVALVGPKVYHGLSNVLYTAGAFFDRKLLPPKNRGAGEIDNGQYNMTEEVEFINGCAFMMLSETFRKIGSFDERFHYYSEEADLCYRLVKRGYKIIYEPRAIVYHWPSTTSEQGSKREIYYRARGHLYFVRKHAKSKSIFLCNILYIFYHFILIFTCTRIGQALTRVVAAIRGIKDSIIGRTGRGPYN